jgi:hypothetical protein
VRVRPAVTTRRGFAAARAFLACASTAIVLAAPKAHAADPTAAESLFQEARALMAEQRYAEACPKLAESYKLDPGAGTLFNLARCREVDGKLASAWNAYQEVAAMTRATGQAEREAVARARAEALRPRLSFLTVRTTANVHVTQDGVAIASADLGRAIPVDAGVHVLHTDAPGKHPWEQRVTIAGEAQRVAVDVPVLEDEAANVIPPSGGARRTVAIALGAGGLLSAGLGAYFGVRAIARASEAHSHCDPSGCDSTGVDASNDSKRSGTISTITFAAAGALVVSAAVVWLTAPARPRPAAATLAPIVGPQLGGAALVGWF